MTLIAETVALEMIDAIKPLIDRMAHHDKALAGQLKRSASSVALNIGEALYSRGGNRQARFQDAMGSANEARLTLKVAVAWGYVGKESATKVDRLLDRTVALLWGLTKKAAR